MKKLGMVVVAICVSLNASDMPVKKTRAEAKERIAQIEALLEEYKKQRAEEARIKTHTIDPLSAEGKELVSYVWTLGKKEILETMATNGIGHINVRGKDADVLVTPNTVLFKKIKVDDMGCMAQNKDELTCDVEFSLPYIHLGPMVNVSGPLQSAPEKIHTSFEDAAKKDDKKSLFNICANKLCITPLHNYTRQNIK